MANIAKLVQQRFTKKLFNPNPHGLKATTKLKIWG
jgi:hypothetical protein